MKCVPGGIGFALLFLLALPAFAGEPGSGLAEAQVATAISAAARAKLAVSETYIVAGEMPDSNEAAGYSQPADLPADISVAAGGVINIVFKADSLLPGNSIVMTPSPAEQGMVRWSCSSPDIAGHLLPEGCR